MVTKAAVRSRRTSTEGAPASALSRRSFKIRAEQFQYCDVAGNQTVDKSAGSREDFLSTGKSLRAAGTEQEFRNRLRVCTMEGARSEAQRQTRLVSQGSRGHVAIVDFNSKPETSAMEEHQGGQVVNWVCGGRA